MIGASPCQGNDRCTLRVFDDAPKCSRCQLPTCTKHSIKINGALLCEICIQQRYQASEASVSSSPDRGRLDTGPGPYGSGPLSQRYTEDERLDFAADFRPGDEN